MLKKLNKEGGLTQQTLGEISDSELSKMLMRFSSEKLLREVYNRNDILLAGWWNPEHIKEQLRLPTKYHSSFIRYCNSLDDNTNTLCDSFEYWLEYIKGELHSYLVHDWFHNSLAYGGLSKIESRNEYFECTQCGSTIDLKALGDHKFRNHTYECGLCGEIFTESEVAPINKYVDFLSSRLEIKYKSSVGFYPEIDLINIMDAYEIWDDLSIIFTPYSGTLKSHLEYKMREFIDFYF